MLPIDETMMTSDCEGEQVRRTWLQQRQQRHRPQPLGLPALTLQCNLQTFGTTCTASCLEGCHPKGSGAYTCGADGTWGGEGSLRCRGCPDNGR